jgi:hypothetical protein
VLNDRASARIFEARRLNAEEPLTLEELSAEFDISPRACPPDRGPRLFCFEKVQDAKPEGSHHPIADRCRAAIKGIADEESRKILIRLLAPRRGLPITPALIKAHLCHDRIVKPEGCGQVIRSNHCVTDHRVPP